MCITSICAVTKADKGNTIMILYQVNIITDYRNFLTVINLQPLILIQFIPKEYKQLRNSTKPLIWKEAKWKHYNPNTTAPTLRGLTNCINLTTQLDQLSPGKTDLQGSFPTSYNPVPLSPSLSLSTLYRTIIWFSRDFFWQQHKN
jgi:hypothetical protein